MVGGVEIISKDPMDYVRVAFAVETLAYHNKNYLDSAIARDDATISLCIQDLLTEAIRLEKRWDK